MIEQRFKDSIDRYVSDGIPTGNFLQSVLENNLTLAVGFADEGAMRNLKEIVQYCYSEIPSICWGHREKVKTWLAMKEEERWKPKEETKS